MGIVSSVRDIPSFLFTPQNTPFLLFHGWTVAASFKEDVFAACLFLYLRPEVVVLPALTPFCFWLSSSPPLSFHSPLLLLHLLTMHFLCFLLLFFVFGPMSLPPTDRWSWAPQAITLPSQSQSALLQVMHHLLSASSKTDATQKEEE